MLMTDTDADDTDDTNNYARQTNHDYIGLFGRIPNEPKTYNLILVAHMSKHTKLK